MFKKIFKFLKNRFVITTLIFIVWMSALDKNSIIVQYKLSHELKDLRQMKNYYLTEIERDKNAIHDITTNVKTLEKYGREKYLMKRDNEDIFLIIQKTEPIKKNLLFS